LSSLWARIVEEKKKTTFVLFAKKKTQKIKKGGKWSLPSNSHFFHHLEAPPTFALLKLYVSPHS
jgi:hypothetical protein